MDANEDDLRVLRGKTMKLLIATLLLTATVVLAQPTICRMEAGQPAAVQVLPDTYSQPGHQYSGLTALPPEMLAAGWRYYAPSSTANIRESHWTDDGTTVSQVVDSVWSMAELDAQAVAAKAAADAALATEIKADARLFATLLRLYWPGLTPPAEQNSTITVTATKQLFAAKRLAGTITVTEVADGVLLLGLFEQLSARSSTGHTYDLPWAEIWK